MAEQTLGESRVRIAFNPSNEDYVFQIKQKAAELIDFIEGSASRKNLTDAEVGEYLRLMDLSLTAIEEGAMWAVKMATL